MALASGIHVTVAKGGILSAWRLCCSTFTTEWPEAASLLEDVLGQRQAPSLGHRLVNLSLSRSLRAIRKTFLPSPMMHLGAWSILARLTKVKQGAAGSDQISAGY